jgi:hypothetical protein
MTSSALTGNTSGLATATSPGLVGTGTQTFAGKKTFSTGALISGDSSGTTIPPGYIGYQVRSYIAYGSRVNLTTTTYTDIASITLGIGTWDITSFCAFTELTAITGTYCSSAIGTVAGNNSTGSNAGDNFVTLPLVPKTVDVYLAIPNYRVIITTGVQTYYMKALSAFSAGTMAAYGRLTAVLVG